MEGGTQQPPPLPAETEGKTLQQAVETGDETQQPPQFPACVSKVLDDDNLLAEIIVRVGFPTTLVRAAAVCRRWLGLASSRAFLRRFRKLHSPRLLGFYLAQSEYPDASARFFPMLPQPPAPELAAVVRRASFSFDTSTRADMLGCWNGRVVSRLRLQLCHASNHTVRGGIAFVVHNPLCSDRGMTIIPTLHFDFQEGSICSFGQLFSVVEEGDAVSHLYVMMVDREAKSTVQVFLLRNGDDAWSAHLTLTVDYLIYARSQPRAVLVDNKIYMASSRKEIVVLDLTASSFSTIQLPLGVDFHTIGTTMLSHAHDASAVYLIRAWRFQIHIWLHQAGNWLLVDKICLPEMCARFLEDDPTASLRINHEGDYNAEFLFLEIGRCAFYLDVKCRTLRKVHEMTEEDRSLGHIYPFMMIWPPIFPALKDGPASNAT